MRRREPFERDRAIEAGPRNGARILARLLCRDLTGRVGGIDAGIRAAEPACARPHGTANLSRLSLR